MPVIFVSADDNCVKVVKARSMGANDNITKPPPPVSVTKHVAKTDLYLQKRESDQRASPRNKYCLRDVVVN